VIKIRGYKEFYAKIFRIGNSMAVLIPSNTRKLGNFNENDKVICMIKKKE